MIIECNNCQKRFFLRDSDIPDNGRTVQCGNCSTQWLQLPVSSKKINKNIDINPSGLGSADNENILEKKIVDTDDLLSNTFVASDGNKYKFLGSQWAQLLPSGKSGRLAKKKISEELNKLSGRKIKKVSSSKKTERTMSVYIEKNDGMSILSFLIVLILFFSALILLLDTFKNLLIPYWPKLDTYLTYIFETINNIYIITKDMFNNYK